MSMFRVSDTLFIGRMNDRGDVRVLNFRLPQHIPPNPNGVYSAVNVSLDVTLPESVWPAIVSAVSQQGNNAKQFFAARSLHNNVI